MTRAAIADLLMAGAVGVALVAMWHLLAAARAGVAAIRAGHGGRWLLWDSLRFLDPSRAPPAARPHLAAYRARQMRAMLWGGLAFLLALPAAILAG